MRSFLVTALLFAVASIAIELPLTSVSPSSSIQPLPTNDPCGQCDADHLCPEFCTEAPPNKRAIEDPCAPCTLGVVCPDWCIAERSTAIDGSSCDCCGDCDPLVCGSFCSTCGCVSRKRDVEAELFKKKKRGTEAACAPCTTGGICPDFCIASTTFSAVPAPTSTPPGPVCDCCQCDAGCEACPNCECIQPGPAIDRKKWAFRA